MNTRLARPGQTATPASPEEFKAAFEREYAELEKLIKVSNIKFN